MDAYWARLKMHVRNASDTYGMQDNLPAAQKSKLLHSVLVQMEALDPSNETPVSYSTPEVRAPDIEDLRRKFLEDDAA